MIYYLSLGANLGNRELTIRKAIKSIEQQIGKVLRCSSFYYSKPWGFESPNEFCNQCCAIETELQPLDVLSRTQSIERELGRITKSKEGHYTDRTIDIDIIRAFNKEGNEIYCTQQPVLSLPHPLWQSRDFVRIPLQEIS